MLLIKSTNLRLSRVSGLLSTLALSLQVASICTILTDNYCEHAYELLQTPNMKKLLVNFLRLLFSHMFLIKLSSLFPFLFLNLTLSQLAGILLDTRNLDKFSKFHTHRDAEATQLLLVGSFPGLRQELFEQCMCLFSHGQMLNCSDCFYAQFVIFHIWSQQ